MLRPAIFFALVLSLAHLAHSAGPPPISRNQIAAWIENLSHDSPKSRAAAARALAETGSEEAVTPLLTRLLDSDADVRLHSAFALGRIAKQPEKSIAGLTRLLFDSDEHVRYAAQWSLAQIASSLERPSTSAVNRERLLPLLVTAAATMAQTGAHAASLERVQTAIQALQTAPAAAAQAADSLQDLIEQLKSDDLFIQIKALAQVKRLDPAAAISIIEAVAADREHSLQSTLSWNLPPALSALGAPLVASLLKTLERSDDQVRDVVLDVLQQMPNHAQAAIPQLIALVNDAERPEELREKAVMVLGAIGPASAPSALVLGKLATGQSQPELLRLSAVHALREIGPAAKSAAPHLIRLLLDQSDASIDLKTAVAQILAKIDPSPATASTIFRNLQQTDDLTFAGGLASSLPSFGNAAAHTVPLLTRLVAQSKDSDELACQQIIEALGEFGPLAESAAPALLDLLNDADLDETLHVAAAISIGKIGPSAVNRLARQLNKPENENDLTIAKALAAIGPQAAPAAEQLLAALSDEDQDNDVRILAAIALGNIGSPAISALPALTRFLNDADANEQLRAMCAVAVGSIDPLAAIPWLKPLLHDLSLSVHVAAAFALCKASSADRATAISHLVELLALEEVRDLAARALVEIGKNAIAPLGASAKNKQHELAWRLACIDVLGQIGKDAESELVAAINDQHLAESACQALCCIGQSVVPALLVAADDEQRFDAVARENIRQLVRDLHDGLGGGDGDSAWGQAHPLARLSQDESKTETFGLRSGGVGNPLGSGSGIGQGIGSGGNNPGALGNRDSQPGSAAPPPPRAATGYKTIQVFYGTNRQVVAASSPDSFRWISLHTVTIVALAICFGCLLWQQPRSLFAISASAIGLAVVTVPTLPFYHRQPSFFDSTSVDYGSDYSDRVQTGVCVVTVPESHEVGELEGPSILNLELTVDPEKHIVLRKVQRLASDSFFQELDGELDRKGRNVLVFIHGYNVSFADAARRTAQMASDLTYPGAAVFYSWPSQANWYEYRVDEKNVELSVGQLKSFLLEVARRSNASTINLVAHSMGNRALAGALKEIDATASAEGALFNQVVLAAPDIDATIFKQRIAPAIVTTARRVTLYASSKDLALFASRQFNSGEARAGDAGDDIVLVPGVETIDASAGDSSLLGHFYYGSSVSVLRDIEHLLKNAAPQDRPFLHPRAYQGMTYWIFNPPEVAAEPMNSKSLH